MPKLTETYESAKYRIGLEKDRGKTSIVRVVEKYGHDDDGNEVYHGDMVGFNAFVTQMNELLERARRFDAVEVPAP